MLLLLPTVYCGCIRTVILLWLRRSRGLRVLLRLLGIGTLARWNPPSHPFSCSGAAGKCCLVLPWAVPQLA